MGSDCEMTQGSSDDRTPSTERVQQTERQSGLLIRFVEFSREDDKSLEGRLLWQAVVGEATSDRQ